MLRLLKSYVLPTIKHLVYLGLVLSILFILMEVSAMAQYLVMQSFIKCV